MPEQLMNEPSPPLERGFVRLRIDLAYDGTMFAGWAIQPTLRTVQGDVENAVRMVFHLPESPNVFVAGRTDAGVHARGQVVHVDVPEHVLFDLEKIRYSLDSLLGGDIRINAVKIAPKNFDARFSAIARRYTYTISDGFVDPLARHYVVTNWRRFDIDAMNEAAKPLLGLHDFASFCKKTDYGTAIRTLEVFSWHRGDHGSVATVQADAFCHSMVRSLIGALVPVGEGRRGIDFPEQAMLRKMRDGDVVTMPAHGLVLEEVIYPADDELLSRQEITRARRENSEVE